jgi:hypothetical protein
LANIKITINNNESEEVIKNFLGLSFTILALMMKILGIIPRNTR